MYKYIVTFALLLAACEVKSAKILGFFVAPCLSHQSVFQPIWRELSLRGHDVTIITTKPLGDPSLTNLTEIDIGFVFDIIRQLNVQITIEQGLPTTTFLKNFFEMIAKFVSAELAHPPVQELIKDQSKHFDILLVEFLHPAVSALSARFNCPMIGITSFGSLLSGYDALGNPSHPVLNPDIFLPYNGDLSFYERLHSCFYSIYYRYYYYYYVLPEHDAIARKYVKQDMPYLGDIENNVSMLFLNDNPIFHPIRPTVPAIIHMRNMHIKPRMPLEKDLREELDNAVEGVIYMSLGSNVRSANLPLELRETIIKCFSKLPYKVFWKWEDDHLPDQPKNIIIRKWFPQQAILGHPHVRLFITQGGFQSMEEAIYYAVPVVGMPYFADQPFNVRKMVDLGIARAVDPSTVTIDEFNNAILDVIENPQYKSRIKELSNLISDTPMTGLEEAIWWIEYVIRHKGAQHLRSPAIDLPLYQYFLLDVLAFVLGIIIIGTIVLYKLTLYIGKMVLKHLYGKKLKSI